MIKPLKRDFYDISVIALLAVNIIPLFGVLFFDWDTFLIAILYCSENVIIIFYTALKIAFLGVLQPSGRHGSKTPSRINLFLSEIPFFLAKYCAFAFFHFVIILSLFNKSDRFLYDWQEWKLANLQPEMKTAFMALFISHGISFVHNFLLKREFASVHVSFLMKAPDKRVGLMHAAVLIGVIFSSFLGSPAPFVVMIIILKTFIDLVLHLSTHKKIQIKNEAQTQNPS